MQQYVSVKPLAGTTLRDFLGVLYGERLGLVLADTPQAVPDLDRPVSAAWERKESRSRCSKAFYAGSTLWFDLPTGHAVKSDADVDAMTELQGPSSGWRRLPLTAKI